MLKVSFWEDTECLKLRFASSGEISGTGRGRTDRATRGQGEGENAEKILARQDANGCDKSVA